MSARLAPPPRLTRRLLKTPSPLEFQTLSALAERPVLTVEELGAVLDYRKFGSLRCVVCRLVERGLVRRPERGAMSVTAPGQVMLAACQAVLTANRLAEEVVAA